VEFLLSLPAVDILARNLQDETAYDIAAERGDIKIYEEIEAHERHLWTTKNPNRTSLSLPTLTFPGLYDPISLHKVIPYQLVENARVDLRTRRPSPTLLTPRLDPPHYPTKKDTLTLPSSTDPTLRWDWITKWSIRRHPGVPCDEDGWRFAQRWAIPSSEWVSDPAALTPTSRAGLVARRVWVRIAKLYSREQHLVGQTDTSESEDVDVHGLAVPDSSARSKAISSAQKGSDERLVPLHTAIAKRLGRAEESDDLPEQSDALNAQARDAKKRQVSSL
jgi:hypothetical protein